MEFKNKRIAVIIAHPDDETIGCGGLLSKASSSGAECKVVLPLKRKYQRDIWGWDVQLDHFKAACDILGATPVIVENSVTDDISIPNIQKITALIMDYINWADIILCHWRGDIHHAHQAVSRAVELCTRPFRNPKTVLCFEIATSTDQGFENTFSPNCFVDLNETDMLNKRAAMEQYKSEIVSGRTPNDLELQLRYRGSQIGSEFAEAYHIARWFIK